MLSGFLICAFILSHSPRLVKAYLHKGKLFDGENPPKDGDNREKGAKYHQLPGKLRVPAHLLGHGKEGDGGRARPGKTSGPLRRAECRRGLMGSNPNQLGRPAPKAAVHAP